jgi:hypothetical protein
MLGARPGPWRDGLTAKGCHGTPSARTGRLGKSRGRKQGGKDTDESSAHRFHLLTPSLDRGTRYASVSQLTHGDGLLRRSMPNRDWRHAERACTFNTALESVAMCGCGRRRIRRRSGTSVTTASRSPIPDRNANPAMVMANILGVRFIGASRRS